MGSLSRFRIMLLQDFESWVKNKWFVEVRKQTTATTEKELRKPKKQGQQETKQRVTQGNSRPLISIGYRSSATSSPTQKG